jgi:hypothetical protein
VPPGDEPESHRGDRLSDWLLRGPLACLILAICAGQFTLWAPHYLTWPWWSDHDVYATLAQGWARGELPYRDLRSNGFPGAIYLYAMVGRLAGWGGTAPVFAMDAALMVVFGTALLAWSQRAFSAWLPGAVGMAAFLSYYCGLDYTLAAQRDWHASFLGVFAILVAQASSRLSGRFAAGLLIGLAIGFRPQAVLFIPPALVAITLGQAWGVGFARRLAALGLGCAVGMVIMFAPLVAAGVFNDFVRSVRVVAYGGEYNKVTPGSVVIEGIRQLAARDGVVLIALALLLSRAAPATRSVAWTWIAAWCSVCLYRPLSPNPHAYLAIPLAVVACVNVAMLVQLLRDLPSVPARSRLVGILLTAGLYVVIKPPFVDPVATAQAVPVLMAGHEPDVPPRGYRANLGLPLAGYYAWDDYRDALAYLRRVVPPDLHVANVLRGTAAITGPLNRRPVFPAESVAWLIVVAPRDETEFARALERDEQSVVVWDPEPVNVNPRIHRVAFPKLEAVIRRRYEPEAQFGAIAIWRRKASVSASRQR